MSDHLERRTYETGTFEYVRVDDATGQETQDTQRDAVNERVEAEWATWRELGSPQMEPDAFSDADVL